jgi:thiol-disulfide isomerase/thioredoxin
MKKNTIIWSLVAVAFAAGVVWLIMTPGKPGKLDSFATCIKDSGATFFGAFWCPHCQATKALFGSSAKLLPYVECSTPDGRSQNQVCNEAKIESYPTWEFKDGTRLTGEQTLAALAEKTSCALPQ